MEAFVCPRCSHASSYDPRAGSAVCPQCGYSPPTEIRVPADLAGEPWRSARSPARDVQHSGERPQIRGPLLDELLSFWNGTHRPKEGYRWPTRREAYALFREYQHALGEDPSPEPGRHSRYVRAYKPEKKAILWFVAAYLHLRCGDLSRGAQQLHDLTRRYPDFPDPWIWLSATTDDPAKRIDYLESAVLLEAAHPLARDALAIAQGKVSSKKGRQGVEGEPPVRAINCPRCGGALQYEPGATAVVCQYCGTRFELDQSNVVDGDATLISDLKLQRRLQGRTWKEVQRLVRCQACGAQLTMTRYLAKQCVFCGSSTVLAEDGRGTFEQPDGFLPFNLDQQRAAAGIAGAQHSMYQRFRTWWAGQDEEITGMQAVYLPFWLFDGFVEVRATGMRWPDRRAKRGMSSLDGGSLTAVMGMLDQLDQDELRQKLMPDKELIMFDNLLCSAMDFPPPWLLKQILPFELAAVVPYEPRLLANWPAALYNRDVEAVVGEVYNEMLAEAVRRKKSLVFAQASDLAELRRMFQVTAVSYQLVLLPIWVAQAQRGHERRLVLVNGQSGRVTFSSILRSKD
jgi:transcription elongation factor Elf1